MATPSPGYSITVRMDVPSSARATGDLVAAVAWAGGSVTALDVTESHADRLVVDVPPVASRSRPGCARSWTFPSSTMTSTVRRSWSSRPSPTHYGSWAGS